GDSTGRIDLRDFGKGLHRLRKIERMQHRQRALEFLLRLWRARGLEQHSPELLTPRLLWRGLVLVRQRAGDAYAGKETDGKQQAFRLHGGPPMVVGGRWSDSAGKGRMAPRTVARSHEERQK